MKKSAYLSLAVLLFALLTSCGSTADMTETTASPVSSPVSFETTADVTGAETTAEPTEASFKRVVIGFSGVDLPVPPYEENGTVYADLAGFADYFSAEVSLIEDKSIAIATYGTRIYTFEVGKQSVIVADIVEGTENELALTVAPKQTEVGMDISITDFATLIGYKWKLTDGILKIYE